MAAGVCRIARSPCGLAITGFSGPGGGTEEKPVGTVFVACATPGRGGERRVEVRRFGFAGGRDSVRWQSAQAALDMLRRALGRGPEPPG
jgi:PncC family amidohydrolase